LNGEKPADLALQLSSRIELFINLKAAKAFGLEPALTRVERVDEVIE
jgi:putative tryptophan/tyrosine transport system substrate-binding protein